MTRIINDESLGVAAITAGSPQVPQDYLNYGAEKSVSAFDRTHRFVANYIYEIPWFKADWTQLPVIKQAFSGWQFSGVTSRQSGQPFTIATGVDSNGNLGKNTLRAPSFPNTDLSLLKRFRTFEGQALVLRVDLLNAFNQDNYGIPINSLNNVGFGAQFT